MTRAVKGWVCVVNTLLIAKTPYNTSGIERWQSAAPWTCHPLPFAITACTVQCAARRGPGTILAIVYIELITRSHRGVELSSAISLRSVKSSWTGRKKIWRKPVDEWVVLANDKHDSLQQMCHCAAAIAIVVFVVKTDDDDGGDSR